MLRTLHSSALRPTQRHGPSAAVMALRACACSLGPDPKQTRCPARLSSTSTSTTSSASITSSCSSSTSSPRRSHLQPPRSSSNRQGCASVTTGLSPVLVRGLSSSSLSSSLSPSGGASSSSSSASSSTSAIRDSFLSYFRENGHVEVPSSSLVPANDPTLLFTNAGMVQFKDKFVDPDLEFKNLGPFSKACTAQRCLRAGGKHNDLENVGYTPRHHTFFEMLGNFSFGDYFKEEAILHAWTFLTKRLCLPPQHLLVTVLEGDDEARDLWRKISGLGSSRIVELDRSENFWTMGEGPAPCGPCSEIFWDQNVSLPTRAVRDVGADHQWLEIWNLVFMQYQSGASESDGLTPLARTSVDTGMGLERMASVLQGVDNNFRIDSFAGLLRIVDDFTKSHGRPMVADPAQELVAKQVVVDHVRAAAFLLADGVFPSNTGRGYVLRRIIRRATRYSFLLAGGNNTQDQTAQKRATQALLDGPPLSLLVPELVKQFGLRYPELAVHSEMIQGVLRNEEIAFAKTISQGSRMLQSTCDSLLKDEANFGSVDGVMSFPPDAAFKLYDTCGFPVDLTARLVEERGWSLDLDAVNTLMDGQRELARQSWKGSADADGQTADAAANTFGSGSLVAGDDAIPQIPLPVRQWEADLSRQPQFLRSRMPAVPPIGGSITSNHEVECEVLAVHENQYGEGVWVSIDPCPFYGRGGGQAGDVGVLRWTDESRNFMEQSAVVLATERPYRDGIALFLDTHTDGSVLPGIGDFKLPHEVPTPPLNVNSLRVGLKVRARVDQHHRSMCSVHHSATHLLNAALRELLGPHVTQAGSSLSDQSLSFDFTHAGAVTPDELLCLESRINAMISGDVYAAADRDRHSTYASIVAAAAPTTAVTTVEMPIAEARASGALGNFGEKYGDVVRVVRMGGDDGTFSAELCGGTHVEDIREIYPFKILRERSVASGTRRIEAVAGRAATQWLLRQHSLFTDTLNNLGAARPEDAKGRIVSLRQPASDAKALMRMLLHAPANPDAVLSVDFGAGAQEVWVHVLDPGDARDTTVSILSSKKVSQVLSKRAQKAAAAAPPGTAHVVTLQDAVVCAISGGNDGVQQQQVDAKSLMKQMTTRFGGRGGGSATMSRGMLENAPLNAEAIAAALHERGAGEN